MEKETVVCLFTDLTFPLLVGSLYPFTVSWFNNLQFKLIAKNDQTSELVQTLKIILTLIS